MNYSSVPVNTFMYDTPFRHLSAYLITVESNNSYSFKNVKSILEHEKKCTDTI